jgi:chitinase
MGRARLVVPAVMVGALTLGLSGLATAAQAAPRVTPAHVFAPYFESYAGSNIRALSKASGASYVSLAFLEAAKKGSCTVVWNGDKSTPVKAATFGKDIAAIQKTGGGVIPSFGGYSADHEGRDIADACTSVAKIARQYEKVVTTYHVSRIDLDVEDNSLNRTAAITRRNKAVRLVKVWAKKHHRTVQFSYTLPASMSGLDPTGVHVLRSAMAHHAPVRVVNAMTFDFYDNAAHEMGRDSITAADAVYEQMRKVAPHESKKTIWSRLGVTEMIGIDDFGPAETFTVADAGTVKAWANKHHIGELSFWALQRDNGGCVGDVGSDSCSGIAQSTWQFSHKLRSFTHRT